MMRPLCEHCGQRRAKKRRRFCSACYRAGVSARARHEREACGLCAITRPADALMHDTGLVILDRSNALVHPDGRVETPVPPDLVFRFFFVPDEEAGTLRVLSAKGARSA